MILIIQGTLSSDKTDILVSKYVELLNSGVKSSQILVIVQNSSLKNKFIEKTLAKLNISVLEKLNVYSFFGLVYNTVVDNWAFLENRNIYDNTVIIPNLAGLEISQFILKDILKEIPFKGYNSKKSLLHQLFRRYSLIVQNNLSDSDVDERAKILKETFADDAKSALKKLLSKTLQLRDFDYLRQTLVFNFIYQNTGYFDNIKYLILDDGDEITPVCFDFINYIAPQLKDVAIAYDKNGASRAGYLSADKNAVWEFEKLFKQKALEIETLTAMKEDADTIFNNVINIDNKKLKRFVFQSPSKRAKMIDLAVSKINDLLKMNIKPSEISIVTPIIDDMLKFSLKENINADLLFISGSEKLVQNRFVQAALTILKLNTDLKEKLSEFDIRVILTELLTIPVKYCRQILENFEQTKKLPKFDFKDDEFNNKYKKLLKLIESLNDSDARMSEQVCDIYNEIVEFTFVNPDEINKFNFFVKQLREFENILGDDFEQRKVEIITQIENSIISENPYSVIDIDSNNLIVSTPQKIIDNQIRTKYQIWLDVSSDEWVKNDTGPLYNAWVFQKGWDKETYTIEDNINLSKDKTARMLRKLVLCADERIFAFSSLFDGNGVENFGGIESYMNFEQETSQEQVIKPIIPRPDQMPVLEYKSGNMAISAVPGAGKTTILLALLLKLLNCGVSPEKIFVLTYMESAARNFREKIKNIRQDSVQLPNISTIHGLALRILKENGNFERLGLSSDFEICDDTQRSRIIREISDNLKLKKSEIDEFDRGISIFKLSNGQLNIETCDNKLKKFFEFFNHYQLKLSGQNLIDYDDMLISSVKLLKENSDILNHYQEICEYIIEDEAQDSSAIQQELIGLLSGKHKNLIRCGDINRAITTTFSNADVEGFRKFINDNNKVIMNCSQRCTKDVWTLANNLVNFAQCKEYSINAFYKIFMLPVEGKNPIQQNAVKSKIFENPLDEKNFVIKTIKNAFAHNPKATVGILLRNNFQVAQWLNLITDSGLKSISRSESLEQKSIFKTIFAIFCMIIEPFDNNVVADNYEVLAEIGLYKPRLGVEIRNLETSFIETDCDNIENPYLGQFYWDLNYWLSLSYLPPEELAIKIGLTYFKSEIEKSNVYLISTLIKRISLIDKNLSYVVQRLGELAKKPSLSGFKFFSEEDECDREFLEGKVQIMTLHKSKGDEFDLVFLPEMTEKNLTLDFDNIKLKSSDFNENIRRTNPEYTARSESDLKQELISENFRLLYVAITRAKRNLYITTSKKNKSFGKIFEQEPSIIFSELLGGRYE